MGQTSSVLSLYEVISLRGYNVGGLGGHLFRFCEIIFSCIVAAICYFVHDVETIYMTYCNC